jgi:hypothetical protein
MLGSITPLGERSRNVKWRTTMILFFAAATAAGATSGLLLGELGALVGLRGRMAAVAVAAVGLAAIVLDTSRIRQLGVPGIKRQVDDLWLGRYRRWVYSTGFGAQLGLGVVTHVVSYATYATFAMALASGSPSLGALVGGSYGAIRGIQPLTAIRVETQEALVRLHGRIETSERRIGSALRWARVAVVVILVVATA